MATFIIPITKDQYTSIAKLCIPLIIISLIATFILFVIFILIRIYYPNLADRVSFRLTFAALFCDIGYSSHLFFGLFYDGTPKLSDFSCAYATWAIIFFGLSSLFFIVCIVLNLHIVFVNEYRIRYNYEKYYFIFSFFSALLISLLPIANDMYGYDDPEESCWYRDSGQEYNIIWQWITLFAWVVVSILYCTIVVIMVIGKLSSATKKVDNFDSSQLSYCPTLINKALISSVVRRVMWYPVVPLVTQFFNSFVETYAYVHSAVPYLLLLLCDIGLSLQGLLNVFVFSQDVAVTRAFEDVKVYWWITNVNSYESHYPHRSHNKAITDEFNMIIESNDFVELKSLNRNKADVITSEWLRYMLFIKLFSAPKIPSYLISPKLLSPIDSFAGNKQNTFSALSGKDDSKQDITLDNQNDDQNIHLILPEPTHLKDSFQSSPLDLLSNCLNSSTLSDPLIGSSNNTNNIRAPLNSTTTNVIDRSNFSVGDDEEQANVMLINGEPTDLSQENETFKLMLKRL
ncbi:18371_t:CDS:2 [Dentiscutata erythropus]|uniref:18371_t:CDS:1 n=1 Tax=Dentiscutata erythropus TaxID=1348616 RepID=A0A9N9II52_9GLOM|nr:18371_t:CDS:2 [Dentiscutata erythropus]